MKVVAISDTHGDYIVGLPEGDVLVYAGDFSGMSTLQDVISFNKIMAVQLEQEKFKHVLVVYGNHETQAEADPGLVKSMLSSCTVLFDEEIVIDGIKFYGTPWTKEFMNWAFMKSEDELVKIYAQIPDDTDVLITHGPPFGILDKNKYGEHCGSKALWEAVRHARPKHHIFGHIHHSYGKDGLISYPENPDILTRFYNVSLLDDDYRYVNKPVVLEV